MTDAENMLWSKLRRKQLKGHQFYRQKIIGKYIVDFYCPRANLVIELDGGQHYSETGKAKDRARDDVLAEMGIKVLRFSDRDVFENIGGDDGRHEGKKGRNGPLDYAKSLNS